MPKTPDGGPIGPLDTTDGAADGGQQGASASERRVPIRGDARPQPGAGTPGPNATDGPAASESRGGRAVGERKKQFLIAPRQLDALSPMGMGPMSLSLASVEQILSSNSDIEIVDKVGPRDMAAMATMTMFADGTVGTMASSQGVLVARMTEQKASTLYQQGQGRLVVERDQYLGLMDPQLQPSFVSSVIPHTGPAFTAVITVVGKDGAPVADAEVSLFGSMLPATAITDGSGQVTLSLFGESAASIRSLYVKPKADYWSFYQRDPDVSSDEPNVVGLRALSDWPSLAGFPRQKTIGWGQKAMRMDQLPPTYRGQGIKIAVIDSGVATTHDSLNRVRAGFDIVNKKNSRDTWNDDTLGHGTHCAGVIGAADLAFGIRGFAPDAELHACKLFPGGQVSQLIDALEYCIEKQIDVVNLSLGGAEPSEALEQQIQRVKRAGIACIVAAGNSGGPVQYPASSPNVLAVAAIGKLDEFPPDSYHAQTLTHNVDASGYFSASFSCFGPQVSVCGPGVAVASTVPPNNYAAWDGTSMAAPHITGLAALVLAHHPEFQGALKVRNAERVERLFQVLKMSARRVSLGDPTRIGVGLPDAVVAVGLQQPMLGVQASLGSAIGSLMGQQGAGQALGGILGGGLLGGFVPVQQLFGMPGGPFGNLPGYGRAGW